MPINNKKKTNYKMSITNACVKNALNYKKGKVFNKSHNKSGFHCQYLSIILIRSYLKYYQLVKKQIDYDLWDRD